MNEIHADGDKPDQHHDGHAAKSSAMANETEAMKVFKQFDMDQRSGNVKEKVAAFNLAGFTDVEFHCKNHMSLFRILETVTPRKMRLSTSIALLSGCGVRGVTRQSSTRLLVS